MALRSNRLLGCLALLALCATCSFRVDPNQGKFSCATNADCGSGYECRPQAAGGGFCFRIGQCGPERCDGLDNDCDGVVDNGPDLCLAGATCRAGTCAEVACADGQDNDQDGLVDCADPDCLGLACSTTDAGVNCGALAGDAGTAADAGTDAGGACVPRESNCANGLDDDGDGKADCLDPDCDGLPCASGKPCSGLACPP